nr:MAG TPA: resistance to inhibitors of cholinesterase-like protein [Bacteriophage sp.]
MSKPNTTEEAVEQLKNIVKSEIGQPICFFLGRMSLKTKMIILIIMTIYMIGILMYSLYQLIN